MLIKGKKKRKSNFKPLKRKAQAKPQRRGVIMKLISIPPDPVCEEVLSSAKFRRLSKYTHGDGDEHPRRVQYEALPGCSPLPFLASCNWVELTHVTNDVVGALRSAARESGMEIGVQTQVLGCFDAAELRLQVPKLRSQVADYKNAGVSTIGALQFVDVPSPTDKLNFAVKVVYRGIVYGKDAKSAVDRERSRGRNKKGADAEIEWLDLRQKKGRRKLLHEAVKRVLMPPLVGVELDEGEAELVCPKEWRAQAPARAFIMLQVLSMLPLDKQVMATGRGKEILMPALKAAQMRLKLAGKDADFPILRDELVHFWFAELKRLGLHEQTVPLILLR